MISFREYLSKLEKLKKGDFAEDKFIFYGDHYDCEYYLKIAGFHNVPYQEDIDSNSPVCIIQADLKI